MTVTIAITLTAAGYLMGFALIPRIVLQKRESGATMAWVLAIALLPYLGIALFHVFGTQRIRWRRRKRQRAEAAVAPGIAAQTESVRRFESTAEATLIAQLPEPGRALALLADKLGRPSCGENAVELLIDARATFASIHAAVEAATSHVHAEYYIWRDDEAGRAFRDCLVAAARRGVEVRVLVDDVGSHELGRRFWRPLVEAGGEVHRFLPVFLMARRFRLNNRNHRKIVVVDGRVGFTGGLNVGDEYFGRVPLLGPWRDTHLRIEGPVVSRLQTIFVEDWFHTTERELVAGRYFPEPVPAGGSRVHVLASGPDDGAWHSIALIHFAAVTLARKRVWLTTPYFVPDEPFLAALQTAALRGVDVRILLPGRLDEAIVGYAARSFYPELLSAGVAIYELGDALLHAKTATVDGCWATVGSANMDRRSFRLNFEANAVVYGQQLASDLERVFEHDLAHARRVSIEELRARPSFTRFLEGSARVLAPIL